MTRTKKFTETEDEWPNLFTDPPSEPFEWFIVAFMAVVTVGWVIAFLKKVNII